MSSVESNPVGKASPRHAVVLTWVLAAAYLLVIAYASLQPFRDWRFPAPDVYGFLTAPWPYYITMGDVIINVVAYVPLGFLVALGLRLTIPPAGAVVAGFIIAVLLSVSMESIQMFLPDRRASNVDVLANGAGGLIGALAAPLFLPSRALGARLAHWRDEVLVRGAMIDAGAVVALLWVVSHLSPLMQAFGTGYLRQTFDWPVYFFHTPRRLIAAEAVVVLCNLTGIGLLLSTLLRTPRRRPLLIAAVIAAALVAKMLILAVIDKSQGMWVWLTPGMALGLAGGVLLLAALLTLGYRLRAALAALAILLALAAINLAPDNPYFSLPPQFMPGATSNFLSFSAILRALAELWPLLALSYLGAALWRGPPRL